MLGKEFLAAGRNHKREIPDIFTDENTSMFHERFNLSLLCGAFYWTISIALENIKVTFSCWAIIWINDYLIHYNDIIMGEMASQITSLAIVYSAVKTGVDQRKHQNFTSLAFMRVIHRWPVNYPHKWPVTRKMFPFDDVIMPPEQMDSVSEYGRCYDNHYEKCIYHNFRYIVYRSLDNTYCKPMVHTPVAAKNITSV